MITLSDLARVREVCEKAGGKPWHRVGNTVYFFDEQNPPPPPYREHLHWVAIIGDHGDTVEFIASASKPDTGYAALAEALRPIVEVWEKLKDMECRDGTCECPECLLLRAVKQAVG